MQHYLYPLLFLPLLLPAAGTWAGPMCREGKPQCTVLNFQLRSIYAPSSENSYGRRAGFLYQDYGKWRKAENPEYPAPADAEKLNISESIEENYILGQRYVLLSPEQKWEVLQANSPERKVLRLQTRDHRRQVDNEAAFFAELPSQLKIKYMMLSPNLRHTAATMRSRSSARRFIDEQTDVFHVNAHLVNYFDIVNHLKPHNAQPMLFPVQDKPPG